MFSADALQQAFIQDYGRLCALADRILQDSHLAQDAVQESWLRLNRARPDTIDTEKLERSEAVRCLLAAMQALEETDRAILQLQYGQGMTGAQIAAALGLHAATVRQRSRRARQKLKQLLEQEGLTL